MPGGYFNHADFRLKSEIFDFKDVYEDKFEDGEISELVWDILNLIHEYDWYKSGDIDKDTYLAAKDKFKKKWFGDRDV